MKNLIKLFAIAFIAVFVLSCSKGSTSVKLNGDESDLPPELKGLKIYSVSTGMGGVKVAILNNQVNSVTYPVGKSKETTILLNQKENKMIVAKDIIFENDSIVIVRK